MINMSEFIPKLIEVPGIPGPIREQTLDEYCQALAPDHLVNRQLAELRNQALRVMELMGQLSASQTKVMELQKIAIELQQPKEVPTVVEATKESQWPKKPCPICNKMISSAPGPWKTHIKAKHGVDADKP